MSKTTKKIGKAVRKAARSRVVQTGATLLAGLAAEQATRALRSRRAKAAPLILSEFEIPVPLEEGVMKLTEALRTEGFGILTRIDVQKTLQEKLGASFRPYLILGACHPGLAHRALTARPEVGLALPCTITAEETPAHGTLFRLSDPEALMPSIQGDQGLREIAHEARERLVRVGHAVKAHGAAVVL
jgi:uncharacterized protein (DUF302 family)